MHTLRLPPTSMHGATKTEAEAQLKPLPQFCLQKASLHVVPWESHVSSACVPRWLRHTTNKKVLYIMGTSMA